MPADKDGRFLKTSSALQTSKEKETSAFGCKITGRARVERKTTAAKRVDVFQTPVHGVREKVLVAASLGFPWVYSSPICRFRFLLPNGLVRSTADGATAVIGSRDSRNTEGGKE